jgi:hypothetical protein
LRKRKYYTHREIAKRFDRSVAWVQVLVITGWLPLGEYRRGKWWVPARVVEELQESSASCPLPEFASRTRNRRVRWPEELWKERIWELGRRKDQLAESARNLEFVLITDEDIGRLRELQAEREAVLTNLADCLRLGERYGFTGTGPGNAARARRGRAAAGSQSPREVWRRLVRDLREESRKIDGQIEDLYLGRGSWDSREMNRLRAEKQEVLRRLKHFNSVGLREGYLQVARPPAAGKKSRYGPNEPDLPWYGGYANRNSGTGWYQGG